MTLATTAGPERAGRARAPAYRARSTLFAGALATAGVAAAAGSTDAQEAEAADATPAAATCEWRAEGAELAERLSPPDSLRFQIGDAEALLCYSRPSARERTMIGGEAVPYGEIWRTGANEPTTLHLGFSAEIAGVAVEPGTYALYTVPGEGEWEVIVNRSTEQWGAERYYTEEVAAQEAGRGTVPAGATDTHVETMTFAVEEAGEDSVQLTLSWEGSRIAIPIRRTD